MGDDGQNIINGFNYEEPPQTDKQHIQLMKQKFNIPPNMTVNTYYMGNSGDDINNAFNEPDNQVIYNPVPAPRMNFEFEDHIPVPFSPIMCPISSTDEENEEDELEYERVFGNNFSQEYLNTCSFIKITHKLSSLSTLNPFQKPNTAIIRSLNEVQLSQQDDEECNSD